MSKLVSPHGGSGLKALLAPRSQRAEQLARARGLTQVPMTSREVSDVLMMAMGAYTPLDGFMGKGNWRRVCLDMKLKNGVFWPIPITLSAEKALADSIHVEEEVALVDGESGEILAIMEVTEKYAPDKTLECEHVYRTNDSAHPGVKKVLEQGEINLAGRVTCLSEGEYPKNYPDLYIRPAQARAMFLENGWSSVAAFQTRNPMHRAHHELTLRAAKEVEANLLIHPVVGVTKPGDLDHYTRVRCYEHVLEQYPEQTTTLSLLNLAMRMAGPRETLWHAIIRKNYGCTHFIVGRDHAGPGSDGNGEPFYGPYDAQELFGEHEEELQTARRGKETYPHLLNLHAYEARALVAYEGVR